MTFKKYPKYKDSAIEWLGEIPEHWELRKAKWLFNKMSRPIKDEDEVVTAFRDGRVTLRKNRREDGFTFAVKEHGYQGIRKNDLVIHGMDAFAGAIGISESDGKSTPVYIVCTLKDVESNIFYFGRIVKQMAHNGFILSLAQGIRERSTDFRYNIFSKLFLPVPPPSEQTIIANFLDYKLEKINRFISKKKQLIELLNEQKAAIINQAVTKGLDPNAKMKDSGIEWLGEIPVHWEVKPLKYCASVTLGKMLCNEDKGGYSKKPYLKSKNIQWLNCDVSDVEEMWFSEKEMEIYRLRKDDLVLSEGGEVGKTCIWDNQLEECYIQNSAHKVTMHQENHAEYFLFLFFIYGYKGGFDSIVNRVSIAHLTKDKLTNVKCLTPNIEEQISIVNHIQKENKIIAKTIDNIQAEITLVEEYKTALIAEAVTGKIDVRGFKMPYIETPLSMPAESQVDYK